MKDELGGKIMTEWVALRPKTYSCSMDDGKKAKETKEAKGTKKCVIKRDLRFKTYEDCNKATQVDNIIKYIEKNVVNTDVLKENYKELIKNNKLTLRTQKRFTSESHNIFTEEVNKISLSLNDDKRIQSIDSVETYAYGTNKDLICEKEEIKINSIIKQCTQ